ncbi:MAG: hypothetical protein J0M00_06700 [Burkholderiales bacterium]|nr:hypothetical protein [Burkholderiales bacterium]
MSQTADIVPGFVDGAWQAYPARLVADPTPVPHLLAALAPDLPDETVAALAAAAADCELPRDSYSGAHRRCWQFDATGLRLVATTGRDGTRWSVEPAPRLQS